LHRFFDGKQKQYEITPTPLSELFVV
jgi:hypothetical protein